MDVLNVQHLKPFLRMRIYRKGNLYTKCIEQMMHSSFVVFYFVFVLWQFPDVSRGIVFLFQCTLAAETTAEDFVHKFHLFTEDAINRRA